MTTVTRNVQSISPEGGWAQAHVLRALFRAGEDLDLWTDWPDAGWAPIRDIRIIHDDVWIDITADPHAPEGERLWVFTDYLAAIPARSKRGE